MSANLPLIAEIKIFNESDRELPVGEIGEDRRSRLDVDGRLLQRSGRRPPPSSGAAGCIPGDLGRFDKEGFLYIVGRKKMIKVAGEIVSFQEVEAALQKHEAVAEAAANRCA